MKKIILSAIIISLAVSCTSAQTQVSKVEKPSPFESAMLMNIRQLDTASTAATFITLANNFERIGNAEKTKWQPFYYAAYSYAVMALLAPDKLIIDALADKAETYLQKAEALEKSNSEITTLLAMVNSVRITVDPVTRFQTKGKEVHGLLAKATAENPENPRIYLLQARLLQRTPEAFGGGKKPAKAAAEKAVEKFTKFQPENSIAPNWGEQQVKSLLEKLKSTE